MTDRFGHPPQHDDQWSARNYQSAQQYPQYWYPQQSYQQTVRMPVVEPNQPPRKRSRTAPLIAGVAAVATTAGVVGTLVLIAAYSWPLALLVLLGGIVAYLGDTIGRTIGKKRLKFWRLRPKHTAALGTFLAGMTGTALTIAALAFSLPLAGILPSRKVSTIL